MVLANHQQKQVSNCTRHLTQLKESSDVVSRLLHPQAPQQPYQGQQQQYIPAPAQQQQQYIPQQTPVQQQGPPLQGVAPPQQLQQQPPPMQQYIPQTAPQGIPQGQQYGAPPQGPAQPLQQQMPVAPPVQVSDRARQWSPNHIETTGPRSLACRFLAFCTICSTPGMVDPPLDPCLDRRSLLRPL